MLDRAAPSPRSGAAVTPVEGRGLKVARGKPHPARCRRNRLRMRRHGDHRTERRRQVDADQDSRRVDDARCRPRHLERPAAGARRLCPPRPPAAAPGAAAPLSTRQCRLCADPYRPPVPARSIEAGSGGTRPCRPLPCRRHLGAAALRRREAAARHGARFGAEPPKSSSWTNRPPASTPPRRSASRKWCAKPATPAP
jgi:hypothetical protein